MGFSVPYREFSLCFIHDKIHYAGVDINPGIGWLRIDSIVANLEISLGIDSQVQFFKICANSRKKSGSAIY